MTILAQTITADKKKPDVPVDVAVRVIAAGIAPSLDSKGRRVRGADGKPAYVARATLALTPVKAGADDEGAIDLADWPTAIGRMLQRQQNVFTLQVVRVGSDGGRTPPSPGNPPGIKT